MTSPATSRTPGLTISPACPADAPAVAAMLCGALGAQYSTTAAVVDLMARGHVLLAHDGAQLTRVVTGGALTRFPAALGGLPTADPGAVGVLKSLVVAPAARGRGTGAALIDAMSKTLAGDGHTELAALSWRSGAPGTSETLFVRAGWRLERVVPAMWTAASIAEGFTCPACGNPCTCSAVLFTHAHRPPHPRSRRGAERMLPVAVQGFGRQCSRRRCGP